jgi:LytS/YehU family sensor histidine kinase
MFNGEKWLTLSEVLNQAKLPAFISVSIAAFFTGTDFLKNWKAEAVRAERLEKEKIATQYESLRNQVNPHFLFNSLNALSELVYENQELAVKYIRQLSQVYRYVLDSRNNEVATIRDELDFLDSFIFLQKIRFGDNLDIQINVEKNESAYVLPLSLQILMENAIKHNVVSEANPLVIRLEQQGQYLVFRNKIIRKKSIDAGTGIGLENIKMRYQYLTDVPVIIEEKSEEFIVMIPTITELP